jgi:hypothetical protein
MRINPMVIEHFDDLCPHSFINGEKCFVEFLETLGFSLNSSCRDSPSMLLRFFLTFWTVTENTVLTSLRSLPGSILPKVNERDNHDDGDSYPNHL